MIEPQEAPVAAQEAQWLLSADESNLTCARCQAPGTIRIEESRRGSMLPFWVQCTSCRRWSDCGPGLIEAGGEVFVAHRPT